MKMHTGKPTEMGWHMAGTLAGAPTHMLALATEGTG